MKKIDNLSNEELIKLYREENNQFAITELYNRLNSYKNRIIIKFNNLCYCDIEVIYDNTFIYCVNKYDENKDAKFYTFLYSILQMKIRTALKNQMKIESLFIDENIIKCKLYHNYEIDAEDETFLDRFIEDDFSIENELFKKNLYSCIEIFTKKYLNDKHGIKRDAVISFLIENISVKELSIKYNCSRQYIYELRKIYRNKLTNYLRKHNITRKDF